MSIEKQVQTRSNSACELCGATEELTLYQVQPTRNANPDDHLQGCATCITQIENKDQTEGNHWRCLNDSIWSQVPAVQVIAWRMLNRLRAESWPVDLLDMLILDDETLDWAKATGEGPDAEEAIQHVDSNGNVLQAGDTVVLIKDLNVKGASFTAKRGTAVRRISLVHDNAEHIEGRVNGQHIVILTKFVKKS